MVKKFRKYKSAISEKQCFEKWYEQIIICSCTTSGWNQETYELMSFGEYRLDVGAFD